MLGRFIGSVIGAALVLTVAVLVSRWGEELWNSRHPVERGYALFRAEEHQRAHPILRHYATWGDPRAQTFLSAQYRYGDGTFQSDWLAEYWLVRAADQGYLDAVVLQGINYNLGEGVEQDLLKARDYYRAAADAGHPEGFAGLGYLHILFETEYGIELSMEESQSGNQLPRRNYGDDWQSEMEDYRASVEAYRQEREAFRQQGIKSLEIAIADGSVWAQSTYCHAQVLSIPNPDFSTIEPDTLHHCVEGGLGGFRPSLTRAVSLLSHPESPYFEPAQAYEYAIVSYSWWPRHYSDPAADSLAVFVNAATEAPPLPEELRSSWNFTYNLREQFRLYCSDLFYDIFDRAKVIRWNLTMQPAQPSLASNDCRLLIDEETMLIAEDAAREFLEEHPQKPDRRFWTQ